MPCSDSGGMGSMQRAFDDHNDKKNEEFNLLKEQLRQIKKYADDLESSFCAICTDLEERNILNEVFLSAQKRGVIDLISMWREHKNDDESRLTKDLSKYSDHELELIKKLLKDEKNCNG